MPSQFGSSWKSSRLPTSHVSPQRSLPYNATVWTDATWTALALSETMLYVFVRVWSMASAAVALSMHRVWCSLNLRCASNHTPSECVTRALTRMDLFPTLLFAPSLAQRCFLWPRQCVNSAASVLAVSNCSPCLLTHSMLFAPHPSSIETSSLTSLPVATQPMSSTKDSPLASDRYSSTHLISPEVKIAKRIGDTGEPCGTPASTVCHSMALTSMIIYTVLSSREALRQLYMVSIHLPNLHHVAQSSFCHARKGCLNVHEKHACHVGICPSCKSSVDHDDRCINGLPSFPVSKLSVALEPSSFLLL